VRILFTFIGGFGHYQPLVAVARAAQRSGHTVAVAGSANLQSTIRGDGFDAFPTSEPRVGPPPAEPLVKVNSNEMDRELRENFARRGAKRHAAVLLELAHAWRPDVVVRDEVDFGAAIAAERLVIPCVSVLVLAAGGFLRRSVVAEPLHALRDEYGLPADPDLAMLDGSLVLSPFPSGLRSPDAPLPPQSFSFRPGAATAPHRELTRPTVYCTLGTVFTVPELCVRILNGLQQLPVDVVITVGQDIDPASLGPQPEHIRVERYIPQDEVLPRCDLVVSHGGSGSVMGALAHGLPSVLMPLGADQPYNIRRCVELGVGLELEPVTVTPDEIRVTVEDMLADDRYRRAAERMRDEINAMPGPEATVPLLEALA
jgi:UDP:flavonoid glycosyltransferase YjiC (YdhE family)